MSEFTAISNKLANLSRFANEVNAETKRMSVRQLTARHSRQIGPLCRKGQHVEGPYLRQCRNQRCFCWCHDEARAARGQP